MMAKFVIACVLVGLTPSYGTPATAQQRDEFDDGLAAMAKELNSQAPIPLQSGSGTLVRVEKDGMSLRFFMRTERALQSIDPASKARLRQDEIKSTCVGQREAIEKGYQFEDIFLDANNQLLFIAISNRFICQRL